MKTRATWFGITLFGAFISVGCSEDGSSGGAATDLSPESTFSDDDVDHMLTTLEFGTTPESQLLVASMGVPAYVDMIVDPPPSASITDIEDEALAAEVADPSFPSSNEIEEYWIHILQYSDDPFREVMTLFWHDLFATSQEVLDGNERHWMLDHISMLRRNATGNLRTFLIEVTTDWVMLEWLDGVKSRDGAPNENFAREFWELFTLGVDKGYTQEDIEEASRVFTGFRKRNNATTGLDYIEFDPNRHDEGDKVIFGLPFPGRSGADGANEYEDMVNFTLTHRGVAEYVCGRLFEFLCYENAPPAVVEQLAETLRTNDYELKPVLRQILKSRAFFSAAATKSRVKSPLEFSMGFVRTTQLYLPNNNFRSELSSLNQRPSRPPGVEGWPNGELWLSAQAVLERANFVRRSISERSFQNSEGVDIEAILPASGERTPGAVVNTLANLMDIDLTPEDHDLLVEYLNTDRNSGGNFEDPFDGENSTEIDKKVRGLLYLLAQHPNYHVR